MIARADPFTGIPQQGTREALECGREAAALTPFAKSGRKTVAGEGESGSFAAVLTPSQNPARRQ
jgi:hypothetical protein